ncbi:MAG: hypothetical protein AAFR21_04875 [Pseudomonadota bacterium]
MGIVLKFFKWVFILLLVAILIAVAWPWNVVVKERLTAGPFKEYLEQNVQRIDLNDPADQMNFEADFYNSKLIIVGEVHGAQKAQDFDLMMMKHLNERMGVRWLMAELSYVQAERFNAYLDTGDETFLEPVFSRWLASATQWGNQQHYEKIKALRAYNLTLPENRRLRYFGVDLIGKSERPDAANWLAGMLEDLPADAPEALIGLREAASSVEDDAFIEAAKAALAANTEDWVGLGIDVPGVRYLVRNLMLSLEDASRYTAIIPNVEAMVREFGIGQDEPVYGFWGLFHSMKAVVNDTARPLALRLSESDLPFADGVTTLLMLYTDSMMNMPSRALPEFLQSGGPYTDMSMSQDNPYLLYTYGIGDMRHVAGGADAAIFSLYTDDSPYSNSKRLRQTTGILPKLQRLELTPPDQSPSEYAVLINGSPALTPYVGQGD